MNTRRGRTELAPEDEHVLLTAATAAPSLHNSQPWSFDVGADHVDVYADPSRQLTRSDPSGRSLLISCGAALFNLRVAAEHLAFHPRVRVLPDAADLTLVANVSLDRRHAHVGGLAAYFPAVAARRTNRLPFQDRPIPHSVLASLAEAARMENAMLRIHDDPNEVSRIVDLLHNAEQAETDNPAVRAERQAWVGGPHRDDGIPARSLGPAGPPSDHRLTGDTHAVRDLAVGQPLRRQQHDPSPLRQPSPTSGGSHPRTQDIRVTIAQHQGRSSRMSHSPSSQTTTV